MYKELDEKEHTTMYMKENVMERKDLDKIKRRKDEKIDDEGYVHPFQNQRQLSMHVNSHPFGERTQTNKH